MMNQPFEQSKLDRLIQRFALDPDTLISQDYRSHALVSPLQLLANAHLPLDSVAFALALSDIKSYEQYFEEELERDIAYGSDLAKGLRVADFISAASAPVVKGLSELALDLKNCLEYMHGFALLDVEKFMNVAAAFDEILYGHNEKTDGLRLVIADAIEAGVILKK